jgi:hypothetical protein
MRQPEVMPCPACGGLQCLCRPRFFAGQLLTEEDLNRLERYIIGKNKLHNRYMHGWGVACGLEVACHPCQGYVTVKTGYALSPCGDDIVVCHEEAVNVCELLTQCRDDIQRHWECDPAWPRPDPNCDEEQQWVLYICYDEKPSQGVTALRGGSGPACCSRCSGGGSAHCGCGCHAKTSGTTQTAYRPAARTTAVQCEPTVTCEGYTFQIRKAPLPPLRTERTDPGKLFHRIADCLKELVELQGTVSALAFELTPRLSAIHVIRQALIAVLEQHGMHNCDLYKRVLQPLPFLPGPEAGTVINRNNEVQTYFAPLLNDAAQECICSALLPPCPEPIEDNCVPLATVTVNCKSGCHIVRVCNWENRQIVPTVPSLGYWFGGFLRTVGMAESLMDLCCPLGERHDRLLTGTMLLESGADAQSIFRTFKTQFNKFLTKLLAL